MTSNQETSQVQAQDPSNQDFLGFLFGSPEKLYDYLIYILIGFLIVSISMLIVIGKNEQ